MPERGERRHARPREVDRTDREDADRDQQYQWRKLDDRHERGQPRTAARAADVDDREAGIEGREQRDARSARADHRPQAGQRVDQEPRQRGAGGQRIGDQDQHAGHAGHHRAIGGACIGIEPAGFRHPAARLGKAQSEQRDEDQAHAVRQDRRRPEYRRHQPRQPEDADPDDAVETGRRDAAHAQHPIERGVIDITDGGVFRHDRSPNRCDIVMPFHRLVASAALA